MNYYTLAIETLGGSEEAIVGVTDEGQKLGIPKDPMNLDYQAFLTWVEEGNTPKPYNPESEPPIA